MIARLLACLIVLPACASAQGFAGMGLDPKGFAGVDPDRALIFPQDHGAHPDYRIEWWYVTANLDGADGAGYGVQFTLFRNAAAPPPQREGWASQQIWLGHAALTSEDRHLYAERLARGGAGQAGVTADPFAAWIDEWGVTAEPGGAPEALGLGAVRLRAAGDGFAYDLLLSTDRPPTLQGVDGYSVKSDRGQASYYYSQPYFTAAGWVEIEGARIEVTGRAWMDREWSTQPLAPDQTGWDWFSLHIDDDAKLMAFRLRSEGGGSFLSGNWIEDGVSEQLTGDEITLTPLAESDVAGRRLPTRWRIEAPKKGVDVIVEATNPRAWNAGGVSYWEGPVAEVGGRVRGYLEMTGYDAD